MESARIIVDDTMGAALIGVVFAAVLYGVSTVQTWFYFTRYSNDPWYTRYLVISVWACDTVHQALITHTVYHYVITHYSDPPELANMIWSVLLEVLFNGFIGLAVQGFLTLRIWRLSGKNYFIAGVISLFVAAEFVCSLVFTIQSLQLKTWVDLTGLKGLSMSVNVLAAAGDILISGCLVFLLHRARTGFHRSNTIISRLIIFTINTGLLTTLCAIASLVAILARGDTLIYVAFYFCIGRLYANTLLATLNARSMIRNVGEEHGSNSLPLSARQTTQSTGVVNIKQPKSANISIQIDRTQQFMRDDDDVSAMKGQLPA